MILVFGGPITVDISVNKNTSKEEFEKNVDVICDLLKRNSDDILHFVKHYGDAPFGAYSLFFKYGESRH